MGEGIKKWWDSYPDHEHVHEKPSVSREDVQRLRHMKQEETYGPRKSHDPLYPNSQKNKGGKK